jgi:multiple antibiotic resistance protein
MAEWSEYAKFFAGLISIVNPIGSVPLFLSSTTGQTRDDRKRTGFFTPISVMAVLMTVLVLLKSREVLKRSKNGKLEGYL